MMHVQSSEPDLHAPEQALYKVNSSRLGGTSTSDQHFTIALAQFQQV